MCGGVVLVLLNMQDQRSPHMLRLPDLEAALQLRTRGFRSW